MYHYLFTNDLRISKLQPSLTEAGKCFSTNTVPSATEDKNANNNMNTLGFYFNLTNTSNCAKECANGNIRRVVLNFVKHFQFPNPRTTESLEDTINDGITLAPMRVIVQVLYLLYITDKDNAYLKKNEVLRYIFFNDDVAKTVNPDINSLVDRIIEDRKNGSSEDFPNEDEMEEHGFYWKQCKRQVREMIKVLSWSGCIEENESDGSIAIFHNKLTRENEADIFEILTCSDRWIPIEGKNAAAQKESYQQYMDISDLEVMAETLQPKRKQSEQKAAFKAWMCRQTKANGQPYSDNTIYSYLNQMEHGYAAFEKYKDYESVFQIQDAEELDEYTESLYNAEGFDEFNDRAGNKACSCGLAKYKEFILENTETTELVFHTGLENRFSRNRILFGAPGTGKSFTLNKEREELLGENNEEDYERVTFHPDYSYANFVGTYKPVPHGDAITYEYVPGPFMRVYVNALKNGRTDNVRPFLLVVEEINRANVAAVFGDIFQLLDRGDDEVSDYPIQASEDIKKYLAKELGGLPEHYTKIRIPDNMFIWATMNSADQGVFPMDTAFKRRWDFTYISINASEAGIAGKAVTIGTGTNTRTIEWNALRRAINERLSTFKINEDKLLGPYFLSKKVIPDDGDINADVFKDAFKNKVLMYLFDDAAKQKRPSLFAEGVDTTKYSAVCEAFDEKGVFAFCTEISSKFTMTDAGETE